MEIATLERVIVIPLGRLPKKQFFAIREAQIEAGKVWNTCCQIHKEARKNQDKWPSKNDLQQATKGQFKLHSQTVQMVCHAFLANIDTTRKLRKESPKMQMKYPWREKFFRPLSWPAQAVSQKDGRVILPMGRGRKSFVFKTKLFENSGSCKIVWNHGYELHVCVASNQEENPHHCSCATVDLGEIHQATVSTDQGTALVVNGRGIRSLKQGRHKSYSQIRKLLSRCKKGSRRHKKLRKSMSCIGARTERRLKDLRHQGTHKVIDFCKQNEVKEIFVGNPDGVRRNRCGRKHNQRMSGWEYGKDIEYLKEKSEKFGMKCFTGSERGTSSQCL